MTPTTYIKTFLDTKVFVRSSVVKVHGSEIKQLISKMCVSSQLQAMTIFCLGYLPFEILLFCYISKMLRLQVIRVFVVAVLIMLSILIKMYCNVIAANCFL